MGESVHFPRMATIKEAAAASGLAAYRIRQLCIGGQVCHVMAGHRYLVNLDKLAEYLNTGDPPEKAAGGIRRIEQ